jgi:hypothetical protein
MERLSSMGVTTADPGYATLASLFHTIARFVQQKTVKTKQQTIAEQSWHTPIQGQAGALFTLAQYQQLQVQLLALKSLSSNPMQPMDAILKQTIVNYSLIRANRAAEAVKHQGMPLIHICHGFVALFDEIFDCISNRIGNLFNIAFIRSMYILTRHLNHSISTRQTGCQCITYRT